MQLKLDIWTGGKFDFNYYFLIICGFQLGGNIKRNHLRNSSVVYAKKNTNLVVKISLTSLQLKKILKLMARYVKFNSTLYFVHSHFGLKLLMKQLFEQTSIFFLNRKCQNKIYKYRGRKKRLSFIHSHLKQLKKLYFVGYWQPGYLTNRSNFFDIRLKKQLTARYPQFGFLNDYKINLISLKEFEFTRIPYSSMVNLNAPKVDHGMYNIPGNGMSYDTFISI